MICIFGPKMEAGGHHLPSVPFKKKIFYLKNQHSLRFSERKVPPLANPWPLLMSAAQRVPPVSLQALQSEARAGKRRATLLISPPLQWERKTQEVKFALFCFCRIAFCVRFRFM